MGSQTAINGKQNHDKVQMIVCKYLNIIYVKPKQQLCYSYLLNFQLFQLR